MALFPKNIVFRNSGNSYRGLKSYFATNPSEALLLGEIFVKYDPLNPDYASILTLDPLTNEPVSPFGNIPQFAGVGLPQRQLPYLTTLVYRQDRLKEIFDAEGQPKDPRQFGPAGPGWDLTDPFPYNLTDSDLEELGDVATDPPEQAIITEGGTRLKEEGDTLTWKWIVGPEDTDESSDWVGYFSIGPGLGNEYEGINSSGGLNDTKSVTYPGGPSNISDKSRLVWSQRDLQWKPKAIFPTLENRSEVDYGLDDEYLPEDGDGLVYDATDEKWRPGDPIEDGVARIPDGRRGVDPTKEALVITGSEQGWVPDSRDEYEEGQTRWLAPLTDLDSMSPGYLLTNGVSVKSIDNSPGDYWDRFEDGAFYIQQSTPLSNYNKSFNTITPLTAGAPVFPPVDIKEAFDQGKASWASNPVPIPGKGLGTINRSYSGDFTFQFWARWNDELYNFDFDDSNPFSDPVRNGDEWRFLECAGIVFRTRYRELFNNETRVETTLNFDVIGSEELVIIDNTAPNKDYHICFVWNNTTGIYKVWVNGYLVGQVETQTVGSSTSFNPGEIRVGPAYSFEGRNRSCASMWIADIILTLTAEHSTELLAVIPSAREFAPPGPWARKIVEGPKAAVGTLGITRSGYFSWVSKDVPYKWNTAFAKDQRYWSEEQLGIDNSYLRGGGVLGWVNGQFGTVTAAGASDVNALFTPGDLKADHAPWKFSSIFNAEQFPSGQDQTTGSIGSSVLFLNGEGTPMRGTNWGYRFGTQSFGPNYRSRNKMLGMPLAPDSNFGGVRGVYNNPSEASSSSTPFLPSGGWSPAGEQDGENLAALYAQQGQDGFHATAIKFFVHEKNDIDEIINGGDLYIDYNPVQDRLRFAVVHYQPNTNDYGFEDFPSYLYTDGFWEEVLFFSDTNLVKSNQTNEVVLVQDFKNNRMYFYVNGKLGQMFDVEVDGDTFLVPDFDRTGPEQLDKSLQSTLDFLEVWAPSFDPDGSTSRDQFYRNPGLPSYINIATGGNQRSGRPEKIRYCPFAGGKLLGNTPGAIQAFATRFDRDENLNLQDTYDFSSWYDIKERHKGFSTFTGAGHGKFHPPQFFQSSAELTNSNARTSQVMGTYLGAGRSLYEIALRYAATGTFGRPEPNWHNQVGSSFIQLKRPSTGFNSDWLFKEMTTDYKDSGAYEISFSQQREYGSTSYPENYYASGPQPFDDTKYFVDVKTTSVQWETGWVHTYRNGFWRGEVIDNTSPYDLATHEPVIRPFADGDILYWDERLSGYVNAQPGDLTYYLKNLDDVTITDPESNDQLFYDAYLQRWVNKDLYYIERVESLLDVAVDPAEREVNALLAWNDSTKKYVNYYWATINSLGDLRDVDSNLNPRDENYNWLAWDEGNEQWEVKFSADAGDYYDLDGRWSTFMYRDFGLKRKIGKGMVSGDPSINFGGGPLTEVGADASNTGRGDGGDFEYGDIDFGTPLGILGGGNFETGEVDLPAEMRTGLDGGEFVKDTRRAMTVPTLRGYQFDPTELIIDLSQPEPGLDRSLRVGDSLTYQAETTGECTINTFDDCFEYTPFYWTEFHRERGGVNGWDQVDAYFGEPSSARYLMGGRLNLKGGDDWSVEFKVRFNQPDTHWFNIFTQGYGGDNPNSTRYCMNLFYQQYNHATMTPWERVKYNSDSANPNKDQMYFTWFDSSNAGWRMRWEFDSTPWVSDAQFRHFVMAFSAAEQTFSVYYNGSRIATATLEEFSYIGFGQPPKPTQMVFRDWQSRDYMEEYFGFGCNPTGENGQNNYLQGGIKDIRIMQHEIDYDPLSTAVPAPPATASEFPLNELPPAFVPNVPLANQQPLLVSLLEFRQSNLYTKERVGVDSVGRRWRPNPFSVIADEVTDPYDESVIWPVIQGGWIGYQYDGLTDSGDRSAYFSNGLSRYSNGWNGRCGLQTALTPELDLRDKTFTIDAMVKVSFAHWNNVPIFTETQLTEELVNHSTILLNVAAEEDLSDVTAGRSWALRLLDFRPSSSYQSGGRNRYGKIWDNGIRFEWWRTDERDRVRYHYLDFWFGPDAFQAITPERFTEGGRVWSQYITPPPDYFHLVVQRDMTEGSLTVICNGARQKQFHPMLKESFRDVTEFANPLMAVGMDANMNFDQGFDFSGSLNYMRILTGALPWGVGCQFPSAPPDLSAN